MGVTHYDFFLARDPERDALRSEMLDLEMKIRRLESTEVTKESKKLKNLEKYRRKYKDFKKQLEMYDESLSHEDEDSRQEFEKMKSKDKKRVTKAKREVKTPTASASRSLDAIAAESSQGGRTSGGHDLEDGTRDNTVQQQLHLLPEMVSAVSRFNWREVASSLPDILRWGLEYVDISSPCWTFTPNPALGSTAVPLTIAGLPVVIPVLYRYPLQAPSAPPPDPFPFLIDPTSTVSDNVVDEVFATFGAISGFYLLISGHLQLLTPDEFDLNSALSHMPSKFGGLNVSYVPLSLVPTGGETPQAPNTATATTIGVGVPSHFGSLTHNPVSASPARQVPANASPLVSLDFDSTLGARIKNHRLTKRYSGKPGVLTSSGSKQFITISTHVAIEALEEANHKFKTNSDWTEKVEAYHGDVKVGDVNTTFDRLAMPPFPEGFDHDVSLIDVTKLDDTLLERLKAPKNTRWMSSEEWARARLAVNRMCFLQNESVKGKNIAMSERRGQLVGQGIFRNIRDSRSTKEKFKAKWHGEDENEEVSKWSKFASRALLYRIEKDSKEQKSNSGTAVCFIEEETQDRMVAGFQSFLQESAWGQYYELEGDRLSNVLNDGSISFYGAFRIPDSLRDSHMIITVG